MTFKTRPAGSKAPWLVAGLLAAGIVIAAALSRGDANWDLQNYHLYIPFAVLNKSFGTDIAPAHMQTFFSPTLDLGYYFLTKTIASLPLLNAIVALPAALTLVFAFLLACRLLQNLAALELLSVGIFLVISATGVANTSTLASTASDMAPACFVLGALLVLIPRDQQTPPSLGRLFGAGLLVGAACGLKLTMSYMVIAIALSLILIPRRGWADIVLRPAALGIGTVLGAAALSGYWWVIQWNHYGNPFFPIMNQIFRSPWAVPDSFVDRTFLPRSLAEALAAPWVWALRLSRATSESWLRDPRFSIALLAAFYGLARLGLQRPRWRPWPQLFLLGVFILGFVLWRLEFSIYRYLAPLEALSGAVMALAAVSIARRVRRPALLPVGASALLAGLAIVTVEPNLNRAIRADRPITVDLGPLAPDSMIILLDNEPTAYLAAFADPRIRFIATNDFFMTLDQTNPMQRLVQNAISGHRGPLWGLDCPPLQGTRSDDTLARYDLVRGECREVASNISLVPVRLCRLSRAAPSAASE